MAPIALHKAGIVPSRDIVMIATADEERHEVGGIEWMMTNHFGRLFLTNRAFREMYLKEIRT